MGDQFLVFTGRPNAGKSSIIRAVTGLKVDVGKDPGTTQRINRYPIAEGLTLIDMPGYGRSLRGGRARQEPGNQGEEGDRSLHCCCVTWLPCDLLPKLEFQARDRSRNKSNLGNP